ncbi:hypothetical protein NDU88_003049 [Pleurodeles waltl]|uniref:Uncharacterized protein n=1 Tax=Pleurodeles waltl TaxID=8319 RepID=A0AAV7NFB4_PLEWA|nr:hypothetical protein NDU88_003049 [Pleurodeles waltl]
MVTPPPGQNRRRGRGSGRRGGWDYVNTPIELYKFVRKLRLIKLFSNKDINRMAENVNMRSAVSGFNIADSSQLMAINDLASESNEVGCSTHDDTNNSTNILNEMGFVTNLYDNSHLKLSSRFNPPLPSGNLIDTFHELVINDIDKFRRKS